MQKINKLSAITALIVLNHSIAMALSITAVNPAKPVKGAKAEFTLSGILFVKGIAFEKNTVVMPVTQYKEKTYTDITFLSKTLYSKLAACFSQSKCVDSAKPAAPKLAILEVKPLKSKIRVANVTVSFDGELSVTFGVLLRNGVISTSYPPDFEVKDASFKTTIDETVIKAFNKITTKALIQS